MHTLIIFITICKKYFNPKLYYLSSYKTIVFENTLQIVKIIKN